MFSAINSNRFLKDLIAVENFVFPNGQHMTTETFADYLIVREKLKGFILENGHLEQDAKGLDLLSQFLANLWVSPQSIQKTNLAYPHSHDHVSTRFLLGLAEKLNIALLKFTGEIKEENPRLRDAYSLLMPTLTYSSRAALKEFILTDEGDYLPVVDTLITAEKDGILKRNQNGVFIPLSETEKARLLSHSPEAKAFYELADLSQRLVKLKDFQTTLVRFTCGLDIYGYPQNAKERVPEIASSKIVEFSSYLDSINPVLKQTIFNLKIEVSQEKCSTFGELWQQVLLYSSSNDKRFTGFYVRKVCSALMTFLCINPDSFRDLTSRSFRATKEKGQALTLLQEAIAKPDFKSQSSYGDAGKLKLEKYLSDERHCFLMAGCDVRELQILFKCKDQKMMQNKIWGYLSDDKKALVSAGLGAARRFQLRLEKATKAANHLFNPNKNVTKEVVPTTIVSSPKNH